MTGNNNHQIFYYIFAVIVGGIFQLLNIGLISWLFLPERVGIFYLIILVTTFAMVVFSLGMDQAFAREFHEEENKQKLLLHSMMPGLIILTISTVLLFLFSPGFLSEAITSIQSSTLSLLIICCLFIEFFIRFLSLQLRMQEESLAFSILQIAPRAIFFFLLWVIVWLDYSRSLSLLLYAHIISILITLALAVFFSYRNYKPDKPSSDPTLDQALLKKLIIFGYPMIFTGLAMWLVNSMDKIFLRSGGQYDELALVSATMTFSMVATALSSIFNTIWMPFVYKWDARKFEVEILETILHYVAIFILIMVLLTMSFSWVLPYLFPEFYSDIQFLILGGLYGPFIYTVSEITGVGIVLQRKTNYYLLISLCASAASILAAWALVPTLGAKGAFSCFMLSHLVFFLLRTHISMKMLLNLKVKEVYFFAISLFIFINSFIYFGHLLSSVAYGFLAILALILMYLNRTKINDIKLIYKNVKIFD
jgi:O-antigen/teichoic acid export membrane protein